MDQDGEHADSPDRSNRRPYPPKCEREHGEPDRQTPFRSPLQPIAMGLVYDGSRVECGEGGITAGQQPSPQPIQGRAAIMCRVESGELKAPCGQGLRRKSRRRCFKSYNQRQNALWRLPTPGPQTGFFGQLCTFCKCDRSKTPRTSAKPIKSPPREALTTTAVSNTAETPRKVYDSLASRRREQERNGENRLDKDREVGVIDNRPHHEIMVAGGK